MAQISEQIDPSNQKIHSYDRMSKMIANLVSKKCEYNNNSTCQLNHPHNSLLMSIVDTPENNVSNVDRKLDKRKIHTYSISHHQHYFLVQYVQCIIELIVIKRRLVLKSYIIGINTSIFPKKHYENIPTEKLVNELHSWIENYPHVIHPPQCKRLIFCQN